MGNPIGTREHLVESQGRDPASVRYAEADWRIEQLWRFSVVTIAESRKKNIAFGATKNAIFSYVPGGDVLPLTSSVNANLFLNLESPCVETAHHSTLVSDNSCLTG